MKKNSSNSTQNDFQISDEMRDLIVQYMEACNEEDYSKAEGLLHKIRMENKKHNEY